MEETRADRHRLCARPTVWLLALVTAATALVWGWSSPPSPTAAPSPGVAVDVAHTLDCDGSALVTLALTNAEPEPVALTWVRIAGVPAGSLTSTSPAWDSGENKWTVRDIAAGATATISIRVPEAALPATIAASVGDGGGAATSHRIDALAAPTLSLTPAAATTEVDGQVALTGSIDGLLDGCELSGTVVVTGPAIALAPGTVPTWTATGSAEIDTWTVDGIAEGDGTVTISADGAVSASTTITVEEPLRVSLAWDPPQIDTCATSATATLSASATTLDGAPVEPARLAGAVITLSHPPGTATLGTDGRATVALSATNGAIEIGASRHGWAPATLAAHVGDDPFAGQNALSASPPRQDQAIGTDASITLTAGPVRCPATVSVTTDTGEQIEPSTWRLEPSATPQSIAATLPSCPSGVHTITALVEGTSVAATSSVTCAAAPRIQLAVDIVPCGGADGRTVRLTATNVGTATLPAGERVDLLVGNGRPARPTPWVLPELEPGRDRSVTTTRTFDKIDADQPLRVEALAPEPGRGDTGAVDSTRGERPVVLTVTDPPADIVAGDSLAFSVGSSGTCVPLDVALRVQPVLGDTSIADDGITLSEAVQIAASGDALDVSVDASSPGRYIVEATGRGAVPQAVLVIVHAHAMVSFGNPAPIECTDQVRVPLDVTTFPPGLDARVVYRVDGDLIVHDDPGALILTVPERSVTLTAELDHPLSLQSGTLAERVGIEGATDIEPVVALEWDGRARALRVTVDRAPCDDLPVGLVVLDSAGDPVSVDGGPGHLPEGAAGPLPDPYRIGSDDEALAAGTYLAFLEDDTGRRLPRHLRFTVGAGGTSTPTPGAPFAWPRRLSAPAPCGGVERFQLLGFGELEGAQVAWTTAGSAGTWRPVGDVRESPPFAVSTSAGPTVLRWTVTSPLGDDQPRETTIRPIRPDVDVAVRSEVGTEAVTLRVTVATTPSSEPCSRDVSVSVRRIGTEAVDTSGRLDDDNTASVAIPVDDLAPGWWGVTATVDGVPRAGAFEIPQPGTPPARDLLALFINGAVYHEYVEALTGLACPTAANVSDPAPTSYVLVMCYTDDERESVVDIEVDLGPDVAPNLAGLVSAQLLEAARADDPEASTAPPCRVDELMLRCDDFGLPKEGAAVIFDSDPAVVGDGLLVTGGLITAECPTDERDCEEVVVAADSEVIRIIEDLDRDRELATIVGPGTVYDSGQDTNGTTAWVVLALVSGVLIYLLAGAWIAHRNRPAGGEAS